MSSALAVRPVEREVRVYHCDKCKLEAVGDPAIAGWIAAGVIELVATPFGQQPKVNLENERHLCPKCAPLLEAFLNGRAA